MTDHFERQVAYIEHCLRVFHPLGSVVELCALNVGGRRAVCEVHADLGELARRAAELDGQGASGVYFTINPLRPDLAGSKASCRDEDVICRRWLPIDVDPIRPAGLSSTAAEKEAAWRVLDRCRGLLAAQGLAGAVVGDSGNGWHLCYPFALPNDEGAKDLVRHVLRKLHERCSDRLTDEEAAQVKAGRVLDVPKAKVDTSTFNASRIWKLPGTMARKGMASAERPHHYARLIEEVTHDDS